MDAKDILGLPKNPISLSLEKKPKPNKESHRKPDGISREVYALTGGFSPLMPSIDVNQIKRKTQSQNEKVTYIVCIDIVTVRLLVRLPYQHFLDRACIVYN
ncbi:hypothetical protein Leryth_017615 [Lithospermum erythrorhizon]|nr:hypothetical protein Leryth_017615 [Lithospermum erythrorhizon]